MSKIENYHLENLKIYRKDVYSNRCIRDHCFTNVAEGDFRGRHFVIGINWFGVPVMYIECKDEDGFDDNPGEDYVGKIGFDGKWREGDERRYFGYDYGHDYQWEPEYCLSGLFGFTKRPNWNPDNGHKYNLVELLMEVGEKIEEIEFEKYLRRK